MDTPEINLGRKKRDKLIPIYKERKTFLKMNKKSRDAAAKKYRNKRSRDK